jgi:hypothetical protein
MFSPRGFFRSTIRFRHLELQYLYSGFAGTLIAGIFSILYSKDLGSQNRGIITAIFLANLLFTSLISGGVNLSYKSHRGNITAASHLWAYVKFSILHIALTSLMVVLSLLAYSFFKTPIPPKILFLSMIYTVASALITQVSNLLISFAKIKLKLAFDLMAVLIQPIAYYVFKNLAGLTAASSILVSFILSYFLVAIVILRKLMPIFRIEESNYESAASGSLSNLIKTSNSIRAYSVLSAITDRLDKIVVLILFSPSQFGVYTFALGFIAFFRFLPDALSNLILSKNLKIALFLESWVTRIRFLVVFLIFSVAALMLSRLIPRFMGEEWRISAMVLAFCFYSEILRGVYIVRLTPLFSLKDNGFPTRTTFGIIVITLIGVFFLNDSMGIASVPASLSLGYLIGLMVLNYLGSHRARERSVE